MPPGAVEVALTDDGGGEEVAISAERSRFAIRPLGLDDYPVTAEPATYELPPYVPSEPKPVDPPVAGYQPAPALPPLPPRAAVLPSEPAPVAPPVTTEPVAYEPPPYVPGEPQPIEPPVAEYEPSPVLPPLPSPGSRST